MQGRIDKVIHAHGFGFIRAADGREVLFHRADLLELSFHSLREGQPVDFELPGRPEENVPRAVIVRPSRTRKGSLVQSSDGTDLLADRPGPRRPL